MSQRGLLRCATLAVAVTMISAPAMADNAVKSEQMGNGYRLSYPTADGSNPAEVRIKFLAKAGEVCGPQGFNFGTEVVVRNGSDPKEPFLFTIPMTCGAKPDQIPQAQPGGPPPGARPQQPPRG